MLIVGALFIYAIVLAAPSKSFPAVYSNYVDPLDVGVCPRALGMGRAYVASADDVNSIFLNPAGLSFAKNWGMTLGTSSVIQETSNTNFGIYFSTSDEAFGFGLMGSSIGNPMTAIPTREPVTGRLITEDAFPYPDRYINSVAILSYGVKLGKYINLPIIDNTSFGISLKGFFQQLESTDEVNPANGFDADIGLIYKMNSWFKVGLAGQNILEKSSGGKISWPDCYEEPIPASFKAGISALLLGKEGMVGSDQSLLLNFDAEDSHYATNPPVLYHGGLEWWPVDYMALRCGVDQSLLISPLPKDKYVTEDNYTGGLGFKMGDFTADLAYHRYGNVLEDTMSYASISYTFPGFPQKAAEIQAPLLVTAEVVQAAPTEECLSIKSPEDRSTIYRDSVLVSFEVLSRKVIRVEINGNKIDVTGPPSREAGEAGKNITTSISVPSAGKFTVKVKCFDNTGAMLKDYKIRIVRLPVFKDVSEDFWARDRIIFLSAINLFNGYSDGTFRPNKTITRAELASIIVKAAGYSTPEAVKSVFKDVKDTNWAAFYIMKGVGLKYLSGYSDDTFRPSKPVTRAEGVSIISRFADLTNPEVMEKAPFDDVPITHWAVESIASAKDAGLLNYLKNKPFGPSKQMTRAEVATILLQTKDIRYRAEQLYNWETGFK